MEPSSLVPHAREADAPGLADVRTRFLTAGTVDASRVRDAVLASWWRSRDAHVAADRIELPYISDPHLDTPLTRSAQPVLRHLAEQLDGQPLSLVLTDASGVVLSRMTADATLERHLDSVELAPGFNYAEQFVGTNGIGSALESGRPMHVFGHEHYAENLEDLACAGVPIRHPITGKTVGLIDLTCWRKDAGPLLLTLAKTTADQVRQALLTDAGLREIELLHEYLRACGRTSGMVFALNNDVVMMNDAARTTLDPADQTALLRHAAEGLGGPADASTVELPTGIRVRMHTRPVHQDGALAGGVVNVKVVEQGPGPVEDVRPAPEMLLPGLVGSGALWRRSCREIECAYRAGGWLAVQGEAGTGKVAVLQAVHKRADPSGRFCVLDGADAHDDGWLAGARRVLSQESGTIVLRHLDHLDPVALRLVTSDLHEAARRGTAWVAVTLPQGEPAASLEPVLRLFPSTVEVPPLRHHVADVQQLVPFFLLRLGFGGKLTCSPEAMQLLTRASWPGNTAQVLDVLRQVVQHRRAGAITATDLPPEIRSLSRRLLSPLESLERDAIVRSLADTKGNKASAARALGLSRATIYRKMHEYGVS